jgi:hypothetical protein
MAKIKHNVILVDISWTKKPEMEMGLREFDSWEEVEKLATHWCTKHEYSTWKLGPIDETVIKKSSVRTKKSKKS